jgi:DNA-binding helix-hairpin-helix protein with protein kinase domain
VEVKDILAELDQEIARLQQARNLLAGDIVKKPATKKKSAVVKPEPKKRKLTPEGRKRIAEAMKRRWAERKKQAAAVKATK